MVGNAFSQIAYIHILWNDLEERNSLQMFPQPSSSPTSTLYPTFINVKENGKGSARNMKVCDPICFQERYKIYPINGIKYFEFRPKQVVELRYFIEKTNPNEVRKRVSSHLQRPTYKEGLLTNLCLIYKYDPFYSDWTLTRYLVRFFQRRWTHTSINYPG